MCEKNILKNQHFTPKTLNFIIIKRDLNIFKLKKRKKIGIHVDNHDYSSEFLSFCLNHGC